MATATMKEVTLQIPDPKSNLLLSMLEPDDYSALMTPSRVILLKLGKRLYRQDEPVDAVYFPLTCMVSLLATSDGNDPELEMAAIGNEGVVGASEVLHSQGALGLFQIQIPGAALRVPAPEFLELVRARRGMMELFNLHLHALTRKILQGAACNHLHTISERCARWILASQDRAASDTFPMTQEFLSHMLGVRRATVNHAIGSLKRDRLISFVRGKMTVINRQGLESASCGCQETVKHQSTAVMRHGLV